MSKVSERHLEPNFVTGFTDAEGCFTAWFHKEANSKIRVKVRFKIGLNARDLPLLKQIQYFFFGIGTLTYDKQSNGWIYSVSSVTDLQNIIIPHFKLYPLLTQKAADFSLFVQIVQLLNKGAHLNDAGLQKIVDIKSSMNKGISDFVRSNFPQINPVKR
jgi:LAGLIDADG endonuclease